MNNNIKGLLLIIFGMLLFIVHDTLIKLTVNDLSLLQILAFRATVGSLILIFYLFLHNLLKNLQHAHHID